MEKILWSGPAFDPSGYGEACRGYISALTSVGIDVRLQVVKYTSGYKSTSFIDEETRRILNDIKVMIGDDWVGRKTVINHATPDILMPIKAHDIKEQVAYSVWETDKVSKRAARNCNRFKFVMTASQYSKDAFINGGVEVPIEIVPHVIEDKTFKHCADIDKAFGDKFVFISNFEWHLGKGYDLLLEAYLDVFAGNPDVLLVMKTNSLISKLGLKESVLNQIKGVKKDQFPSILPITDIVTFDRLYSLYGSAHCYVLPTRREAWCLTASEAAMFELPIIIPDIGGQRQFLQDGDALFIRSEWGEVGDVELERSNYADQQWVCPDVDSLKEQMKEVYDNYSKWKENAVRVKQDLLENYSKAKIAKKILSALEMHRETT